MARKGKFMKFNSGKLRTQPPGEVTAYSVLGRSVRRELQIVDGVTLYRYTLDPGFRTEFSTFWSTDAGMLFRGVLERIEKKK